MPNAQPYSETCLDVDNVVWSGNLEEIDADCICLQIVQGPGGIRSSDSGVDLDDVILMLSVCCLLFLVSISPVHSLSGGKNRLRTSHSLRTFLDCGGLLSFCRV